MTTAAPKISALGRAIASLSTRSLPKRMRVFKALQEFGLHITPVHFYYPIPDTRELPDSLWSPRSSLPGIDLGIDDAFARLEEFAHSCKNGYAHLQTAAQTQKWPMTLDEQSSFGPGDAEALYAMIRSTRPARVIEVGCGFSSLVIMAALRDGRIDAEYTLIEPHPHEWLADAVKNAGATLRAEIIQHTPAALFDTLQEDDVLFLDSSHVVSVGSDTNLEILELLPRLNTGVIIHFHDIFLPEEYPRHWFTEKGLFWQEQYLLHAFLMFNSEFEVILPMCALCAHDRERVCQAIPSLRKNPARRPGSFWIRRKNTR